MFLVHDTTHVMDITHKTDYDESISVGKEILDSIDTNRVLYIRSGRLRKNIFDLSDRNRNITINGVTKKVGKLGDTAFFDGADDYLQIANNNDLNFDKDSKFSIVFWEKNNMPAGSTNFFCAKQDLVAAGKPGYNFQQLSGTAIFTFQNDNIGGDKIRIDSNVGSINLNKWTHIALTYDGTQTASGMKLYIDGVEGHTVNTDNLTGSTTTTKNFRIGIDDANNFDWNGEIDEFAVYRRELTAKEVRRMYNQEK